MNSARSLGSAVYSRLPIAVQLPLLVRARTPLWIDRGIVFIHIPRTAGTSINRALYGRFMGHSRARDIDRWGSRKLRSLPRFSVTRNPWDRLVSAYRFAKRGTGIGDLVAGVWKPRQYQIPEFESFERFLFEWLAPRDIKGLDPVFQPQWPFVCDSGQRLLVDHLGRVEDMKPTYQFIERTVGKIAPLPRTNLSGPHVNYQEMYTAEMAQLVGEIYRDDVVQFGYDY